MIKVMKDTVLNFRVSSELKDVLKATAKLEKRPMAKVARDAIKIYCINQLGNGALGEHLGA